MNSKICNNVYQENTEIGSYVKIGDNCILENVFIDDYSYLIRDNIVQNAKIAKFVNIAANVRIGATFHPMDKIAMHHFTYRSSEYFAIENDKDFFESREAKVTVIEDDVWIGHGAIIMPNLKVGRGSVIGALSVVTKDVLPYSIVAGNPARLIKMRFDDKTINKIENTKWWEWSHDKLMKMLPLFRKDAKEFLDNYENIRD